jgi:hypothetical protein
MQAPSKTRSQKISIAGIAGLKSRISIKADLSG